MLFAIVVWSYYCFRAKCVIIFTIVKIIYPLAIIIYYAMYFF